MALAPLTSTDRLVNVFLNVARDPLGRATGMLYGYRAGDELRHVFRLPLVGAELDMPDAVLAERVFGLLNVGDDPAFGTPDDRALAYRLANLRSLSVGDVIELDNRWLAVAGRGFIPVEQPHIDSVSLPF